ncbi:MAG: TrkA family potassium uptake protein [Kiritimatiellia bacterium]|jgi:trk system potassium uptake protein TrkA|nr:TrkA family potassium uptake protein [Kiritimatiellia bacterium]
MKRIGIIGAGRFGSALIEHLAASGTEILLLDHSTDRVQHFAEFVTRSVAGDATQARTLQDAGFQHCDVIVVAIGSNLEGSILATVNSKELGVPTVVARANSVQHGTILRRVGADMVIDPNRDSSRRLGRFLLSKAPIDLFEVSDGFSLAEIDVPEALQNKTLAQAAVRKKFGVTVLCVRRQAEDPAKPRIAIIPAADEVILPTDKLLIFGEAKRIAALA